MKPLLAALALSLAACQTPTVFHGQPTVPQGPTTCEARCSSWGMELVGMVSMGESYTDGCICAVPDQDGEAVRNASVAIAGATAGVEVMRQQNEADDARRRRSSSSRH
jgi:hypothetical protein